MSVGNFLVSWHDNVFLLKSRAFIADRKTRPSGPDTVAVQLPEHFLGIIFVGLGGVHSLFSACTKVGNDAWKRAFLQPTVLPISLAQIL